MVGGIVSLGAALYSYNIGILFLPVPILYLLIDRNRITIDRLSGLYTGLVLVALPFVAWHLAVGGVGGFFKQDLRWMTENG